MSDDIIVSDNIIEKNTPIFKCINPHNTTDIHEDICSNINNYDNIICAFNSNFEIEIEFNNLRHKGITVLPTFSRDITCPVLLDKELKTETKNEKHIITCYKCNRKKIYKTESGNKYKKDIELLLLIKDYDKYKIKFIEIIEKYSSIQYKLCTSQLLIDILNYQQNDRILIDNSKFVILTTHFGLKYFNFLKNEIEKSKNMLLVKNSNQLYNLSVSSFNLNGKQNTSFKSTIKKYIKKHYLELLEYTPFLLQEITIDPKYLETMKQCYNEYAKLLTSYANTYVSSKESLDEFNKQIT
jgi:hypothetical protein